MIKFCEHKNEEKKRRTEEVIQKRVKRIFNVQMESSHYCDKNMGMN